VVYSRCHHHLLVVLGRTDDRGSICLGFRCVCILDIIHECSDIIGVGTAAAIAPVYIGELAPTRFRGAMVTIQSIAITGGQFIAYCIGIPLTGHHGWRIQFAIGVIPAVIQGAAM
jgi:MFS family permease